MATYKVIQDIEAEDKLLGPLSLRQFIYAAITIFLLFLTWQLTRVQVFLGIPMLIPAAFFGLLAAPIGVHQSSEIWLLAKIRYFLKPRRRIWDQSGIKQLVTITVPKLNLHQYTNNLSQSEVQSRLQALSNTLDSRGWAVKNVNVNMYAQTNYAAAPTSDRLVDVSAMPQEVANYDVNATDDILDAQNNPTAQHLDEMISASTQAHRETILSQMKRPSETPADGPAADYWFMNQPQQAPAGQALFGAPAVVSPSGQQLPAPVATPTAEEQALLENIHHKKEHKGAAYGHMRTLRPIGEAPDQPATQMPASAQAPVPAAPTTASTNTPDPAILNLANNDDLDVATIARQANKKRELPPDEVVISLR